MLYEIVIPILAGSAVVLVGAAVQAARRSRQSPMQARLREVQVGAGNAAGGAAVASGPGAPGGSASLLGAVGQLGEAVASGKVSSKLREQLASAGYHNRSAAALYLGSKMLLFALGLLIGWMALWAVELPANIRVILMGGLAGALFFVPNVDVYLARQRRQLEVRLHLPDAIDLLEICVSSGMGLDQAWNSVADEVRVVSPRLADEMALTDLEIHLGETRAMAMRHMGKRTGSRDLASLVAILVQSERFGTSIAEALRTFAASMREQRSTRAQEFVEKMAVKLIFPMVLFIFPAVVIVMAGPAILALGKALAS